MSIHDCDKIVVSNEQYENMVDWASKNVELFDRFEAVFNEGLLEVHRKFFPDSDKNIYVCYHLYFVVDYDDIHEPMYTGFEVKCSAPDLVKSSESKAYKCLLRHSDMAILVESDDKMMLIDNDGNEANPGELWTFLIRMYHVIMTYIYHYREDTEHKIIYDTRVKKSNPNKKKKGKAKDRVVKISRNVYTFVRPISNRKVPKKKQWKCGAWGVRGHIRHMASGKIVRVKPYVKGKDKEMFQVKTYKA